MPRAKSTARPTRSSYSATSKPPVSASCTGNGTASSRSSRRKHRRRVNATTGVTVRAILDSHPESFGLPVELLAGREGLDRAITSPYIQKTGLALAGFHEYLRPGRILIFGESEIRYLESLETSARASSMRLAMTLDFPCVL